MKSDETQAGGDVLGQLINAHRADYARWLNHNKLHQRLEFDLPRHPPTCGTRGAGSEPGNAGQMLAGAMAASPTAGPQCL